MLSKPEFMHDKTKAEIEAELVAMIRQQRTEKRLATPRGRLEENGIVSVLTDALAAAAVPRLFDMNEVFSGDGGSDGDCGGGDGGGGD